MAVLLRGSLSIHWRYYFDVWRYSGKQDTYKQSKEQANFSNYQSTRYIIIIMFALRNIKPITTLLRSRPIPESLKASSVCLRKFSLLTETQNKDATQQMFSVGKDNGFLPRQDPLAELPKEFSKLESLLQRMPMQLLDGTPGLLASGQFGDAVRDELPLYEIDGITDQRLLSGMRFMIKHL